MGNRAERLKNTVERRVVTMDDFEIRSEGNALSFKGYASLFNVKYEMYGGPDKGGWMESVNRDAFKRTLAAKPDVVLNMNHGQGGTGLPIARTTSGTLTLRTDAKGLLPEASLDLRDPDVQALQVKAERGDVNQMSFAFRTISDLWTNEEADRELMELSLDRGDVSIVTNGASPTTSFQLRDLDDALAMLAGAEASQLVEVRGAHGDQFIAVHRKISAVLDRRDGDGDPVVVTQAVDAVLDAIEAALMAGDVDQAVALLCAADLSVDALLVLLGAPEPAEPGDSPYRAALGRFLSHRRAKDTTETRGPLSLAHARRVALLTS